ncbi:hypothetical protein V6Z12_A08G158000 [Gossypium hirsutum]
MPERDKNHRFYKHATMKIKWKMKEREKRNSPESTRNSDMSSQAFGQDYLISFRLYTPPLNTIW